MVSHLSYPAKPVRPSDPTDDGVDYPDSDGQPMSDNTLQFAVSVSAPKGLRMSSGRRPDRLRPRSGPWGRDLPLLNSTGSCS